MIFPGRNSLDGVH